MISRHQTSVCEASQLEGRTHTNISRPLTSLSCPLSAATKHGHPTSQERNLVSTLDCHSYLLSLITNLSLSLDRARFPSFSHHTTDLGYHTDITLKDVPDGQYTLRLFVENEEREVQKTADRSWTPAQRQYARSLLATHTLNVVNMQRYFFNFQDTRGDPKEDRSRSDRTATSSIFKGF